MLRVRGIAQENVLLRTSGLELWRWDMKAHKILPLSVPYWSLQQIVSFLVLISTVTSAVNLLPDTSITLIPCRYSWFIGKFVLILIFIFLIQIRFQKQIILFLEYFHMYLKNPQRPTLTILEAFLSIGKWQDFYQQNARLKVKLEY